MIALSEAKHFVELHARHMGFDGPRIAALLGRIASLDGDGPRDWVTVFTGEALASEARQKPVEAANLYNLARFPVADSDSKRAAARAASQVLGEHIERVGAGERRIAQVGDRHIPFLFRSARNRSAGLVVLMGGIVSLKEQWGAFLGLGRKLGCAVAIADFAGVGENSLPYSRSAGEIFSAIMDTVSEECDASRTLIIAPSFGGHLAMLQTAFDPRIREIVTIGAPIRDFFLAAEQGADIPLITRVALASAMRVPMGAVADKVGPLALSQDEIERMRVPTIYVAARRDEIIPASEWRVAARQAPHMRVHEFDDVHGAPNHLRKTRMLILAVLLRHAGRTRLSWIVQRLLPAKFRMSPPISNKSL